jgi:acyl-CoA synthetase (AMP-forming)/AMP-acid ligase II
MATLPDNLGYLFDGPLDQSPSAIAVIQGDRQLSYEELDRRCNCLANALRALGVQAGDRVALLFDNDFRFLDCCFGAMRTGAVPVPLNIRMGDDALAFVLDDCEAEVMIASEGMCSRARPLASRVPRVHHLILDEPSPANGIAYEAAVADASPDFPRQRVDPNGVCMQPYTSGSTGKPKGVLLTHHGQIWNSDVMRSAFDITERERGLVAVPLYHKNAMIGTVKPFLLAGGSFVILRDFDPVQVIEAIERHRVTYMTGVPAMFKMVLAERDALARHDVSSVQYVVCGSAEVPEELFSEFEQVFGAPMAESYGLTEGGPVPIINRRGARLKRGSCGTAFHGCDVKLVAEDGVTEVGDDQPGELVTKNPGLAAGYWKRPEATAQKFRDGWLHTGDLMRRDADGYFYFLGRHDDMINVAGENVYPKEVEDLLLRHPGVSDVCVVPMPHDVKGSVPVAFIVVSEPGACREDELKEFTLAHGAPYAHPRRIFFLDALPLGGTGKVDRGELRRRAAGEAS